MLWNNGEFLLVIPTADGERVVLPGLKLAEDCNQFLGIANGLPIKFTEDIAHLQSGLCSL